MIEDSLKSKYTVYNKETIRNYINDKVFECIQFITQFKIEHNKEECHTLDGLIKTIKRHYLNKMCWDAFDVYYYSYFACIEHELNRINSKDTENDPYFSIIIYDTKLSNDKAMDMYYNSDHISLAKLEEYYRKKEYNFQRKLNSNKR